MASVSRSFQKGRGEAVPFLDLIHDFGNSMYHDRGLSSATIRDYCWHAEHFLGWLEEQSPTFGKVSITHVDQFLALNGTNRWTRVSVASCAKALRAFFRHAERRGWCASGFAAAIESPRIFKQEGLPSGPAWKDVQRLLASTDTDRPRDIRDRAVLMLFAIYGLRGGEVTKLRLEDIDWEREVVKISRPKQRRTQEYPLTRAVGEAIIRYLKEVRPGCTRREVFLTLKAPFRRLSPGALHHMTATRFSRLGIEAVHRGPHALSYVLSLFMFLDCICFFGSTSFLF